VDIPAIVEGMHRSAGFDVGDADMFDLAVELLGPRPVRIIPARYDGCGIDPLVRTSPDGFKIRVPESAVDDPARRSEQLALGLAVWQLRAMEPSRRRARAVRLLVHELLYPSAVARSGVIKAAHRAVDDDDVPVPRSSNG
jgi:hypothetical protein